MSVTFGCQFQRFMMTTALTVSGLTSGLGCHGHQEFGWSEERTERDVIDMYYNWFRSSLLVGTDVTGILAVVSKDMFFKLFSSNFSFPYLKNSSASKLFTARINHFFFILFTSFCFVLWIFIFWSSLNTLVIVFQHWLYCGMFSLFWSATTDILMICPPTFKSRARSYILKKSI